MRSGLPDFWCNVPNGEKYTSRLQNIANYHKIPISNDHAIYKIWGFGYENIPSGNPGMKALCETHFLFISESAIFRLNPLQKSQIKKFGPP
jgi:hypothetical protein